MSRLFAQCGIIFGFFLQGCVSVIIESPLTEVYIKENNLTISCRAENAANLNYVNNIQILRNTSSAYGVLVTVTYDRANSSSTINWQDKGLQQRATADGDVHNININRKFLRLTILTDFLRCPDDEGTYTCSLHAVTNDGYNYDREASTEITIRSVPAHMNDMHISSQGNSQQYPGQTFGRYPVGHVAYLTCSGTVGKPPGVFRWCIKSASDMDFMILNAVGSSISHSEATISHDCNYIRSSMLNYTVDTFDTNTTLLCEPVSTLYCGRNTLNKTFVVQVLPTIQHPTDKGFRMDVHTVVLLVLCILAMFYVN